MVREYNWRFVGSAGLVWRRKLPPFFVRRIPTFLSRAFVGMVYGAMHESYQSIIVLPWILACTSKLTCFSIQLLMADCPLLWGYLITLGGALQLRLVFIRPLRYAAEEFESHCCSLQHHSMKSSSFCTHALNLTAKLGRRGYLCEFCIWW